MTIIIAIIIASIVVTVIDFTIQKVVLGTIEKPIIIMIIEEVKAIIENRE